MTRKQVSISSDSPERLRYLCNWHGSLLQCAMALDIPLRRLTAWVTGEHLRINPSCGRGRYGVLSLFKFALAQKLLDANMGKAGTQIFLDCFLNKDFLNENLTKKMQSWLIVREDEKSEGHLVSELFTDTKSFALAVRIYSGTPIRFTVLHLGSVLDDVVSRLVAWLERREPTSPIAGKQATKALNSIRAANLAEGKPANAVRK